MDEVSRFYLSKAINLCEKLRTVLIQLVGEEKSNVEAERDTAAYLASDKKYEKDLEDMMAIYNEELLHPDHADEWQKLLKEQDEEQLSATELLSKCDTLLYGLLSYEGADTWKDADDFETKEILKLKEILLGQPNNTLIMDTRLQSFRQSALILDGLKRI